MNYHLSFSNQSLVVQIHHGCLGNHFHWSWLGRLSYKFEKEEPSFVTRFWLGKEFMGDAKFEGRSTETKQMDIPMETLVKSRKILRILNLIKYRTK
jgi:hypothetical protein